MEKLVIIDGNAIVHRAYHALPPMNSKDGEPTNAVYGFFSMLIKLLGDLEPKYLIVCFDRAKPTFRKQLYVGYQATRPKMSDDLIPQISLVHKVLDKANIAHFGIDGYEADDLIGSFSKQSGELDIETIIVTGDRDLLQLVNNKVKVLAPILGITKMELFDEEKVEEKYGLKPSQFIDYKALVGDQSDNYPGVSGVGPKTASQLLRTYNDFENLYAHIAELPENLGMKLAQDAEQAALARKLATIVTDAPVKLELAKVETENLDKKGLIKAFEELGFKSLMARVGGRVEVKEEVNKEPKDKKTDQLELI